jgi:hypothetical protein
MLNDPNDQIIDDTFTLVQIHVASDGLPTWLGRSTFYGVAGIPTAIFDGTLFTMGASNDVQQMFDWYLSLYNQRRVVPTDVTLTGTGVETGTQTITVHARVCLEPGGTAKTVRIYMVQELDHFGCSYCRNTFMQAATTEDIVLLPGECAVVETSFTYDNTNWTNRTDSKIVVWAQEPQDSGPQSNPAEVYNAHTMAWPFPGPDCNGNGIPDVEDIAAGTSADCNANAIPDECDIAGGTSADVLPPGGDGIPDECQADCNGNQIPDDVDIANGTSYDWNGNGIPDECDSGACCQPDGTCDLIAGIACGAPGQWLGPDTICDDCPPPVGAGCFPDDTCTITTEADCPPSAIWLGPATTCDQCLPPEAHVALESATGCYHLGDPITVDVNMSGATAKVTGGQFFLEYDSAALQCVSAEPGDAPFTLEIYECSPMVSPVPPQCTPTLGLIDYAVGVTPGGTGTATDTTLARITFTALAEICNVADVVVFRSHDPPTMLTDAFGSAIPLTLADLPPLLIDSTPPVLSGCPLDQPTVQCYADVPPPAPVTALDNCDGVMTVQLQQEETDPGASCNVITRTWTATDSCGNSSTCGQTITVNDTTAPDVTCPADVTVKAEAGCEGAHVTFASATAQDNCDNALPTTCDPPSGSFFPLGPTTVTCSATDACGNIGSGTFTVTVEPINELVVTVDLDGIITTPVTRCITVTLWTCDPLSSVVAEKELTFQAVGGASRATATLDVPCGAYTCLTARDRLHTLRRTLDGLPVIGTQYVADFAGAGKPLIGGNLDDSRWIDILDFGVFMSQWNVGYDSDGDGTFDGNTTCSTPYPHADASGDGLATTADFTFIQTNFLLENDANCCGQGDPQGDETPVTRISVADLIAQGLGALAAGDVNADGWLDEQDMDAFAAGLPHAGDLNCDGVVDFRDINPFVLYLSDFAAWQAAYTGCPPENGDINGDGTYPSFADINPFVALLAGS